jgi:hypothetical protein
MKICDLPKEKIVSGMRVKSPDPVNPRLGTIVQGYYANGNIYYWEIEWDGDEFPPEDGFVGNDCECEIVGYPQLEENH